VFEKMEIHKFSLAVMGLKHTNPDFVVLKSGIMKSDCFPMQKSKMVTAVW